MACETGGGYLERKFTFRIGADTDRRAFHDHGGPDHGNSGGVAHDTGNCRRPVRDTPGASILQHDIRALNRIGDVRSPEHGFERLPQRSVYDLHRDDTVHIHVVGASEKIFRLTLNLIHNLLHTDFIHADGHTNVLRMNVIYGIYDRQNE